MTGKLPYSRTYFAGKTTQKAAVTAESRPKTSPLGVIAKPSRRPCVTMIKVPSTAKKMAKNSLISGIRLSFSATKNKTTIGDMYCKTVAVPALV